MLVQQDQCIVKCSIGYFFTIGSAITETNTVHEILCKALEVKNAVRVASVEIVFDKVIYTKAVEVLWKQYYIQEYSTTAWNFSYNNGAAIYNQKTICKCRFVGHDN